MKEIISYKNTDTFGILDILISYVLQIPTV